MAGDHNDFDGLPSRADRARGAIRNLSDAFEDLSKNGTLTNKSVNALAGALGAIPHPGAQVASIGLQIGAAFLKASEAAERLKEQELADELRRIGEEAESARERVATFRDVMLTGATVQEARLLQQINDLATSYVRLEKANSERVVTLRDEIEKSKDAATSFRSLDEIASEFGSTVGDLASKESELSDVQGETAAALANTNRRIAALKAELDKYRESLRPAKKGTEELKDELIKLKGVDLRWEAYTPTPAEIESVYKFKDAIKETGDMIAYSFGDVGAAAFDQYYIALDRVIDGQNAFGKNAGRNYQNATAEILKALGREAAARAVMHLAMAAAAAVSPWAQGVYGTAPENLKAAALFGSVAVMAGAGGAALSSASPGGGRGRGRDDGGTTRGGPTVNVTIIGNPDYEQKREIARWVSEVSAEGG